MITVDQIKKLREETGVSISECQKALKETEGDIEKAKEILKKRSSGFAAKKSEREAKEGIVDSYIHPGKKIGVLLELGCESDFVAKSEDFQKLAHELCLQIAAVSLEEIPAGDKPKGSSFEFPVAWVLEQPWIKDEQKTVKNLIDEYISKIGENIILRKITRYEI